MYNRDSRIMRKLLGKTAAPETSASIGNGNGNISIGSASTSTPTSAQYRPQRSQNAVYHAGVPIACLDVSADRRAAILGGPHILKTVVQQDDSVDASSFSFGDGIDLRARITAHPPTGVKASTVSDQLNIRDVRWRGDSTIITACANGRIFLYDIARIGAGSSEAPAYIQIQEDSRQVHSLDVNPHLKTWLLTGSQDGIARVFDTKNPSQNRNGVITFRQKFQPLKCTDSVTKVLWSPRIGHEMACCTEMGVVMKWDVRQPSRSLLRINAHEKACSAIAWHPDGTHLISAGSDAKLHVWDLGSSADKRQKPKWTLNMPAPVSAVAWRPGIWSASAQSKRVAQVAVAYDDNSSRRYGTACVHLWDLARPSMPYKEIERFDSSPTALSWQCQDILWTVGRDGLFNQCDVAFAPNAMDRLPTSAHSVSPRGDVLMFLDERPPTVRPRHSAGHQQESTSRASYGSSQQTGMLSASRSDSEEELLGSFLGPRTRPHHKRRLSARSLQNMSTTPPSVHGSPDDPKHILGLDQAIKVTGIFRSQQGMASGHVPAATSAQLYQHLSSAYLETLERELPFVEGGKPLVKRVTSILESFARAAESVNLFRLSQTWRILSFAMALLLQERASFHLEARMARLEKAGASDKRRGSHHYIESHASGQETPRQPLVHSNGHGDHNLVSRSLAASDVESTSNMATPKARPVDHADDIEYRDQFYQHRKRLSPIMEPDSLSLGPSTLGPFEGGESPRRRLDSTPISLGSHESDRTQISSTEGYDFYDTAALADAIDVPKRENSRRQRRTASPTTPEPRARMSRQNSDESYGQMFSISAGTRKQSAAEDVPYRGEPDVSRPSARTSGLENGSSETSTEFESRIRGEQQACSKDARPLHPSEGGLDSPENVFMISQTTAASDESYPSQASESTQPNSYGGMTDDVRRDNGTPTVPESRARPRSPPKTAVAPRYDASPTIIEGDYLPWPDDPPYPFRTPSDQKKSLSPKLLKSPLDPYKLVSHALEFESRTSALSTSAIILLLRPLVPDSVIDFYRANAVLRQHHSRLMGMSLFVEATLLRNLCVQGWPEGLPTWGDNYTSIFAGSQQDVKVSYSCSSCHKPREIDPKAGPTAIWTCERCKSAVAPCAVCHQREAELAAHHPDEILATPPGTSVDSGLSEWWYCPGCGHGGHASCLQTWHGTTNQSRPEPSAKYSGGCCPLDGCGHACLPGQYRGETTTARAEELSRAAVETTRARNAAAGGGASGRSSPRIGTPRSVKSDGNDVPQSRAVGVAREALSKSGVGGGGSASPGGILSSSPGRAAGGVAGTGSERERRKSVKFARS